MELSGNYDYQKIPGLVLPKMVEHEQINAAIDKYIDLLPGLTERLEYNLWNKRYSYLTDNIEQILALLKDVCAKWLESDGGMILRVIKQTKHPPGTITTFISDLHSLSIQMQKAQLFNNEKPAERAVHMIEFHANIVNKLSVILRNIDSFKPEKAKWMIEDIQEHSPDELTNLLELVTAREYNDAKLLARQIKDKHTKAITQLGTNTSKKVLAVDDSPEILSFISNILKDHYRIFCVANGKTALKVMEAQNPDLFILDIDMPEMDGYELAGIIRADAGHVQTPIIFLTGNSTREHVLKAIQAGANDFLVKPATREVLLTMTGKYLS